MKKIVLAAVASLALVACKSNTTSTPAATATPAAAANTPAATGPKSTLTATVEFTGTAPTPKKLPVEADAYCAKTPHMEEDVMVKDGKLANVMIRVVKGAPEGAAPSTPATIEQSECMYRPRVMGIVKGQDLTIKSMDDTTHNVHAYHGEESLFNRAENKGADFTKKFDELKTENGVINFKCDIHPWMTGYVVVNDNPYFAVTDATGTAKIDLPAGKYTIEAWQEKYGTKTAEVTVEEGKPAEVKFSYAGTEKPAM